jgi:hypothetical protein
MMVIHLELMSAIPVVQIISFKGPWMKNNTVIFYHINGIEKNTGISYL